MKQIIGCLSTVILIMSFFLLLTACTEAEAEVITEPTPVVLNEVTEEVIEEIYWPLTAEERDLVERVVAAEARGECIEGQMAVAQVIMDRCTTRNQTITQVCTAKSQFATPYQGTVNEKTKDAVSFVFDKGDRPYELVTHFYAWTLIDAPYWTTSKDYVDEIGCHRFYADR